MEKTPRSILIVDDSPEDRELYCRYLQCDPDFVYIILEADLGQEGLTLWQQHRPDALLLDYRLSDLDGLEFLSQIQATAPYLPVIMITGQGNEAIAVQAMKAGAQDYLVKELITPEGLQLAVNGTIAKVQLHLQLQQCIERERLIAQITQKIHQTLDLEIILTTIVTEVRRFLHTDRVIIFRLQADGSGRVTTESVGADWTPLLATVYYDPCFQESYSESFRQGIITSKADIHDGSVNPCHVELLARLEVRANLVVPILQNGQLWGMLIAHNCQGCRTWQAVEVELLKQLATQLGIAVQQAELYQQAQLELTERRRVEIELRTSEERYRTLFESIDEGFCIIEVLFNANNQPDDYRFLELNPAFANQSGLIDAQGKTIRELIPNPENHWFEIYGEIALVGKPVRFTNQAEDLHRWYDIYAFRIGQPKQHKVAIIFNDITQRRLADQEREQLLAQEKAARAEAERANRIKDEFLAVLSHELRSPLNPILGWAKLLQTRTFDPAQTAEALATIERNAKLQTQLINDLLDIAKILRGKLSIETTSVDLALIIESALDTVRTSAVAKSIRLHSIFSPIGQVSGDAARLQQVIWNLLSNAIKFTANYGRVDIRLEQIGNQVQITISDTGKGIEPDFLPHIFESFCQEDASTTRKYGGLGLGLAIVRQVVEAHGGTITANSPGSGLGATFILRLPLLKPELRLVQTAQVIERELDLTGVRVLAVDDEPDTRKLLTVLLTQYGAEVLTVASVAETLANMESFQPDLLVSDIGMPDVDGYSLIQQVRALPAQKGGKIPVIALTAYASEANLQRALSNGYQQHITKPFDPEDLIQAIATLIQLHRLQPDLDFHETVPVAKGIFHP